MAEDTRDYIEQTQSRSVDYNGRELSPGEMAREFMKCDLDARVSALQSIAAEQREYSSPAEAAKHQAYRRALRNTHERLRKVGR